MERGMRRGGFGRSPGVSNGRPGTSSQPQAAVSRKKLDTAERRPRRVEILAGRPVRPGGSSPSIFAKSRTWPRSTLAKLSIFGSKSVYETIKPRGVEVMVWSVEGRSEEQGAAGKRSRT